MSFRAVWFAPVWVGWSDGPPLIRALGALRASGVKGDQVDTVRFAEVRAGKLAMPSHPASLYQLFGPPGSFDAASGTAKKAQSLYIVYLPGATAATTGLSVKPAEGTPWLMFPGTPKAHIMFEPKM